MSIKHIELTTQKKRKLLLSQVKQCQHLGRGFNKDKPACKCTNVLMKWWKSSFLKRSLEIRRNSLVVSQLIGHLSSWAQGEMCRVPRRVALKWRANVIYRSFVLKNPHSRFCLHGKNFSSVRQGLCGTEKRTCYVSSSLNWLLIAFQAGKKWIIIFKTCSVFFFTEVISNLLYFRKFYFTFYFYLRHSIFSTQS